MDFQRVRPPPLRRFTRLYERPLLLPATFNILFRSGTLRFWIRPGRDISPVLRVKFISEQEDVEEAG